MADLQVSIPTTIREGDEVVVYGDWGAALSGSPLRMTPGPVAAYPRTKGTRSQPALVGWHRGPWHLGAWHGEPAGGGGWHRQRWHQEKHRRPRPVITVSMKDVFGYGPFTVGVKPANSLGAEDAGAPSEQTIFWVEPPLPVESALFADFNVGDGTLGFTMTHASLLEI